MRIDLSVETPVSASPRARQLEALFDVPYRPVSRSEWHGSLDLDAEPWHVGLIVGPSGVGKTLLSQRLFGEARTYEWSGASVIDDFAPELSMEQIASACQAVGFNTIPAWLRPYAVLSNGEKFRVELARHLLSDADPIVVDEFSSVVDRQVAKIASHAVQKYVRRANRRFVAVACHYDIVDWLQPDWVFEPATWNVHRRPPQGRPSLECSITQEPYAIWRLFAPFHYLTSELNRAARCFVLWVGDQPAAFAGMLWRPHVGSRRIYGLSRLVTLPDWQGLGLAFALSDRLAALYRAQGADYHTYPAHPSLVRSLDRSPVWQMIKRPGRFREDSRTSASSSTGRFGGRPNAVFRYVGPAGDLGDSQRLLGDLGGAGQRPRRPAQGIGRRSGRASLRTQ